MAHKRYKSLEGFKGLSLSHIPNTIPPLNTGWVPAKGALRGFFQNQFDLRVFREIRWRVEWGFPAYATLGCPLLPVPLRHPDAHLPFWSICAMPAAPFSQVQMVIPSLPPPTLPTALIPVPLGARAWAKASTASQHCLFLG